MVSPSGADLGLVGRGEELGRLRRAVADLAVGRGSIVVLSGEAGIGKTRLVTALLDEARARGLATVVGRADEIEADRPFGAVADAAEREDLAELAPVRRAVRPSEHLVLADRTVLVAEALVDGLEALAVTAGGVVVVLEDVHWADAGTVAVLRRAPHLVGVQPVLVAVTLRGAPIRRDLDLVLDELRRAGAVELALGPLAPEEIDDLAARQLGERPGGRLSGYLAACAGNPFYALELIGALISEGTLEAGAERVELVTGAIEVPPSLRVALVRRLGFLPPASMRLLQQAALLGRSFTLTDLVALTGSEPHDLLEPLEAAQRSEVIDDVGGRWVFRHDLVRHALVDELPAPARKALHRGAARALAAAGAPAATVARQYALGAEPGDADAVAALRRAALDALRTSVPVGIELLETALDLTPNDQVVRAQLVADLMDPLDAVGRHADAEQLARGVLAGAVPTELELVLRRGWAVALAGTGNIPGAVRALDAVVARPSASGAERAVAHATAATIQLVALDLPAAAQRAASAQMAAADSGDRGASAFAASVAALTAVADGRPDDALAVLDVAELRATARSDHRWTGYNLPLTSALATLVCDDLDTAVGHLADFGDELEASGSVRWRGQATAIGTLLPYLAGDLDAAEAACETALSTPLEYGPRFQVGVPGSVLALIAWRRGDLERAERDAASVEEHYRRYRPEIGVELAALASALVHDARGDVEAALATLARAWELTAPVRHLVSDRILGPELVRLAVGRDGALAVRVADELDEGARRNPVPSALGAAALCRGLITAQPDLLIEAVDHYRRSPRVLDLAGAAGQAARALRAAGRRREAATQAELARDIYADAGALGDLERLRRLAGLRRRAGVASRPTFGWGSLTPTEHEVVGLLRGGLTNRQIGTELGISRRTVETHLAHVFTKVGVTTRVELAVGAANHL